MIMNYLERVADGYLISKVFLLLEEEMKSFVMGQ